MKLRLSFRMSLILSVFLLVVTPIVISGFVTLQTAERALLLPGIPEGPMETIQVDRLRENIVYMLVIGTVISLTGAALFTTRLAGSVSAIRSGLESLAKDKNVIIPPLSGVMGEIAGSINRLAQALRETRSHRDALLVSSPNGLITVDALARIILFNPAAETLTGVKVERALGEDFHQVGLDRWLVELLDEALALGNLVNAREEMIDADPPRAVAVSTSELKNSLGEGVGALAVLIDLKEKRLLEDQVLRANRLAGLGELAAGIAHEIRNPLTAVKGFTQLIEEELPEPDEKRRYTGVITSEVARIERLVKGLLDFARPSESRFNVEDVNEILEETLILVNNGSFRRKVTLEKDYGDRVTAEVDREQLKQIFLNLLLNAGQAIKDQGIISISTGRQGQWVWVNVADSGSGISQEHLGKLFDPFFSTKEKGTGLGLAMVHRLVDLHGGKVLVSSQPGRGSEFRVVLPALQGGVSH